MLHIRYTQTYVCIFFYIQYYYILDLSQETIFLVGVPIAAVPDTDYEVNNK